MKVKFSKTKHVFSVERYPARFGYRTADGKDIDLGHGDVITVRFLGFEIKINKMNKKKN